MMGLSLQPRLTPSGPLASGFSFPRISGLAAILGVTGLLQSAWAVPTTYVDAAGDFIITTDQGTPSVLDAGDVVSWQPVAGPAVTGLVFGTDAFTSVQAAVNAVDAAGTVYVAAGTYDEGSQITVTGKTIEGEGQALTFLSGGGDGDPATSNPSAHRVLQVGANTTLSKLAIVDGEIIGGNGAGISGALATNVVISNCTIAGNATDAQGGGIFSNVSIMELIECTIKDNVAGTRGGGVYTTGRFSSRRNLFQNNSAGTDGGGIYLSGGGASTTYLHNTTFSGNTAGEQGGGAFLATAGNQECELRFCTFTGNSALISEGAMWINYAPYEWSFSLFVGNSAPVNPETNFDGAISTYGAITSLEEAGVESLDELLAPLADNGGPTLTHRLLPGSNAVDRIYLFDPFYLPQTDQRGLPRFYGMYPGRYGGNYSVATDYGAYEINEITVTSEPRDGSTNVPIDAPITFTFNGDFTFDHLDQVVLRRESDNAAIPFTPSTSALLAQPSGSIYSIVDSPAGTNLTLTPLAPLTPGENYHVEFNAAIATNDLSEVYGPVVGNVISFQTSDITPPLIGWRILHGLDPAGADDLGNPSGDGVANLLKYAFNMAPLAGDLSTPNTAIMAPGGDSGLPLIEVSAGPRLSITYVRRKASAAPGITYQAMSGEDLVGFSLLDPALETVTSIDDTWERVTIVDPVISSRRFGTLKITR